MAYSALCLWIPEIRLHYKHSDKKFGPVGSIGCALLFWLPALTLLGIWLEFIPRAYFLIYLLFILAIIVMLIGFVVDPPA